MIEALSIVLPARIDKIFFSRGYLRREFFGVAVVPSSIRHKVLLVEWTSLVEGKFVVIHSDNFIVGEEAQQNLIILLPWLAL